jgi:hypothetical protein
LKTAKGGVGSGCKRVKDDEGYDRKYVLRTGKWERARNSGAAVALQAIRRIPLRAA